MYDEKEEAYAVIRDDKIDVRTVSESRRAAIVNWLVVACDCPVFNVTTDEEIERLILGLGRPGEKGWQALKPERMP